MNSTSKIRLKPRRRFPIRKPNASVLLFIATIIAVILANSPWAAAYQDFLSFPVEFTIGGFSLFSHHGEPMTMLQFVNDALMAVFFFVIGLEIKQEILIGELSSVRKAMLPVIAAIGGMIVPVLFYLLVCHTGPEARGAAIPMATDIAFALAVLGALGSKVPLSVRIFLTALAVVDDIGGIIVIALFYSDHVAFMPLLISFVILAVIYIGGRCKVNSNLFYYLLGFAVWLLFMESGIHSTIAGVLVAFMVPATQSVNIKDFSSDMKGYLGVLDFTDAKSAADDAVVFTPAQVNTLNNINSLSDKVISPMQTIAERLTPLVNYIILPLFAFVNAGVTFGGVSAQSLLGVPLAILLGLYVGKTLGIFSFSYLAIKLKLCSAPSGMTRKVLFGVAKLGGIGFTVALFIANLSFDISTPGGADLLNQAKMGVFAGSLVSGIVGYLYLKRVFSEEKEADTLSNS